MLGNWLKTSILMAAIMALFGLIGGYVGGASGMMMALLFGGAMNLFAYWFSDSMVLKMYNAQEVDESSAPQFYAMVRELAQRLVGDELHRHGSTLSQIEIMVRKMPHAPSRGPRMLRFFISSLDRTDDL